MCLLWGWVLSVGVGGGRGNPLVPVYGASEGGGDVLAGMGLVL